MNMDLSTVKGVSPGRSMLKKVASLTFSVVVILVSFIYLTRVNEAAKDTVDVVRVKAAEGLPAYVPITENHIETYSLIRREYQKEMILAEQKDKVIGKMAKYFIRHNNILYQDQLTDERPLRNEWLYKLEKDQEVITIPYNYLEAGGDVLMPGDKIRLRVSYEVEEPAAMSGIDPYLGNPNAVVVESRGKTIRTEVLFEEITVLDMLNADSHSVYEVYKEVLKLDENQRQQVMKSNEFRRSIVPRSLLLAATREQVDRYARFKSLEPTSFLITILSRAGSDVILDQLPTLENEVKSWIGP